MSPDVLRRAAALMRERAEAASPSPWRLECSEMCANVIEADDDEQAVASTWAPSSLPDNDYRREEGNAAHIASWDPAVALAVADWLDYMSKAHEDGYLKGSHALVVARAYLGETS